MFLVLNFPKIRVRLKMTLLFLSSLTNLLYDGLLKSQILFPMIINKQEITQKKKKRETKKSQKRYRWDKYVTN